MRLRHFVPILTAVSALSFTAAACSATAPQAEQTAAVTSEPASSAGSNTLPAGAQSSDAASVSAASPPLPLPDPAQSEKGEKGARGVLLTWARAIEFGRYDQAWAQWGDGGKRSGLTRAQHAAQFAAYKRITVGFGDGEVEGAAGSLYYEVPVDFTGVRKAGGTVKRSGTIVLRRVNDVDGATPAQLRWHIDSTTLMV